jgi:hypothetical protein
MSAKHRYDVWTSWVSHNPGANLHTSSARRPYQNNLQITSTKLPKYTFVARLSRKCWPKDKEILDSRPNQRRALDDSTDATQRNSRCFVFCSHFYPTNPIMVSLFSPHRVRPYSWHPPGNGLCFSHPACFLCMVRASRLSNMPSAIKSRFRNSILQPSNQYEAELCSSISFYFGLNSFSLHKSF